MADHPAGHAPQPAPPVDPRIDATTLLAQLGTRREGLTEAEAAAHLASAGQNVLRRRGHRRWPADLARQFVHPLALLLWLAAALSYGTGEVTLGIAICIVIALNAVFAFAQERQAERAIEALSGYLPQKASVRRDGIRTTIDARALVPGDVLVLSEGDRVSADARLLSGALEVDLSTLTGESQPVLRSAALPDVAGGPLIEARTLVFSGSTVVGGEAEGVVYATGMTTELGRIAGLTERTRGEESPLEAQVRRVAWLIAVVALAGGIVFMATG